MKTNKHENDELFNEFLRLECVGDAVIALLAREILYRRFSHIAKQRWTKILWIIVSNRELHALADSEALAPFSLEHDRLFAWKGKASAFEALVGRLFLEHGIEAARDFFEPLVLNRFDVEAMAKTWAREKQMTAIYKPANEVAK